MNGIRGISMRVVFVLAALAGGPAQALELEFFDGEVYMTVSHSLHYGANFSIEKNSPRVLYAGNASPVDGTCGQNEQAGECQNGVVANPTPYQRYYSTGGKNSGPNDDMGHHAFNRGAIANQFKGTTDIQANWGEFTAFTRLLYFYDYEIMNRPRNNHPITGQDIEFNADAREEIGADFRTLGAYVAWDTFVGDRPVTLRVGEQVINWGQSTFLPGIGLTNPVDLNRLSAPGFELRELFKPVDMVFASIGLTENIAVEAYYQYGWEPLVLPPGGSFWALNNYTGAGIDDTGQAIVCLDGSPVTGTQDANNPVFAEGPDNGAPAAGSYVGGYCINANPTDFADDGNEWGLRMQITLPWLNYTQFSLYAIRYHSRLPHVGATLAGIVPNAGRAICDGLAGAASTIGPFTNPAADLAALGIAGVTSCEDTGDLSKFPKAGVMYQEDLYAYGFSWSSNLPGGWSFAGEVSLKKDFPVQASLPELIGSVAGISANVNGTVLIECSLRELDVSGGCGALPDSADRAGGLGLPRGLNCDPSLGETCDAFGAYQIGSAVFGDGRGFQELDLWQTQFTLIKLFPQALFSDNLTFVFEAIYARVHNMPKDIQFERPDFTDYSNASRADDHGWGWRALFKLDYTSLFGSSWNVSPLLVLFHDVDGSLPANTATFYEGRRQAIMAFLFDYQNQYQISLKYGYFGGYREGNIYQDRDIIGIDFATQF